MTSGMTSELTIGGDRCRCDTSIDIEQRCLIENEKDCSSRWSFFGAVGMKTLADFRSTTPSDGKRSIVVVANDDYNNSNNNTKYDEEMRRTGLPRFCGQEATVWTMLTAVIATLLCVWTLNQLGVLDAPFTQSYDRLVWPVDVDVARQWTLRNGGQAQEYLAVYDDEPLILSAPSVDVCRPRDVGRPTTVLVVVKSYDDDDAKRRRDAWRRWWTDDRRRMMLAAQGDTRFRLYFVLESDGFDNRSWTQEQEQHDDLIVSNRSIGLSLLTVKWTAANCPSIDYLLLISDTYRVSLPRLQRLLRDAPDRIDYAGYVHRLQPVDRRRYSDRYVSLNEYPFDYYPPYVDSGAVLLSGRAVGAMNFAVGFVKRFRFDEVHLGLLARSLRLSAQHLPQLQPESTDCDCCRRSELPLSAIVAGSDCYFF